MDTQIYYTFRFWKLNYYKLTKFSRIVFKQVYALNLAWTTRNFHIFLEARLNKISKEELEVMLWNWKICQRRFHLR